MESSDLEPVDSLGSTQSEVEAVNQLLESPRLAHIWFSVYVEGNIVIEESRIRESPQDGLTLPKLSEYLSEVPQTALRDDLDELENLGVVKVESSNRPIEYRASFLQVSAENVELVEDGSPVGPKFIGLVGEAFVDDKVREFLDEFGRERLKALLERYVDALHRGLGESYVKATMNGVDGDTLKSIFSAMERVLLEVSRDPMWLDYQEDLPP